METWFLIIVTACLAFLLRAIISLRPKYQLPPGPQGVPIISSLQWLRKISSPEFEPTLRSLYSKFGPIITLDLGSRPFIFISSHALAHQTLVQNGAIFADRPEPLPIAKVKTTFKYNINSSGYGPFWRTLRRNLTSQLLHPSRLKETEYSPARKWALGTLLNRLSYASDSTIKVVDHIQFAMFCFLVHLCFGVKLEESKIREIEDVQKEVSLSFVHNDILNFFPNLTRIFLRKRWDELLRLKNKQHDLLVPLIRARKEITNHDAEKSKGITTYVDTLLNLEILDDDGKSKRKLTDEELVSASSEILSGGTDTTSTTLEWIMANIVKYPNIQAKLFDEIRRVIGPDAEQVEEEDLPKIPYVKAVVLEGLRRHPPGHFVLPHSVTQDVELGGYVAPKNAIINFAVAEMGWDSKVWEDPMEFKPERFMLANGQVEFDLTGNREIKMMPFSAGRRVCPGMGLAILIMEYFVANLVWKFDWTVAEGHEVDLSEVLEFTTTMKHPLHARISRRHIL